MAGELVCRSAGSRAPNADAPHAQAIIRHRTDLMWLFLTLATAFFVSLQDVFGKKALARIDPYVAAFAWVFFSLPLLSVSVLITGVPELGPLFYKALVLSAVILVFASLFYFRAIKYSDLSIAVPMLTLTPLFLLFTSPMILGEFPGHFGMTGVILIVLGSYILHVKERHKGFWAPFRSLVSEKGSRYMLMVALLYSISGNFDKIGVVHSSPVMWIFSLHFLLAIGLGAVMLKRTTGIGRQIKDTWPLLIALGTLNGLGLIFQMFAIKMTLVPYLIAVKRTSVVMTSLFGFFLFKEKGLRERLIGVVLMALGVFMISYFQ